MNILDLAVSSAPLGRMGSPIDALPEVFSARELAAAAGVKLREVRAALDAGHILTLDGTLIGHAEAVRAGRVLRNGGFKETAAPHAVAALPRSLFGPLPHASRSTAVPLTISTALHVSLVAGLVLLTTMGFVRSERPTEETIKPEPLRLVYLAQPGPGGGGGGGGLRQPKPPPKAERKGTRRLSSPLPARTPPKPIEPAPRPVEPPKAEIKAEPLPAIVAPIVTAPSDPVDRAGVLEETEARTDSRGPGSGGGVGTGTGTGIGEGDGSGIGPGSGGGTGGGPYRPGSGIDPPRLLREIKPNYTEEARRRGLEGDVLMEIVVRRDGTVGDVRLLQRLGSGLDERAIEAVRQWRFAPARLRGAPVDVLVEVAVEFNLR